MLASCPGPAELARIGRGTAAGSCPPEWEAHIEDCPECQGILERFVANGLESFVDVSPAGHRTMGTLPEIDGFAIERELGRGAVGVVYLARREAPSRQVALKLWPGGRRAGARERRQWVREAEAASVVRHPHVVTLYEASVTDDWFLLALEYVPGGTLADRLSQPLAARTAARMAEIIARAVHHIHRSGLLHLDLKPSNILLDSDAAAGWEGLVPKVTDFGIARAADASATDTGTAGPGGTPSYMAPEQVTRPRKDLTAAADVHGLGAILYHMLTGRPPYLGATVLETIDLLQRQEPVPPRRMNPQIPRDLETICLKCLHKEVGRRYASAEALADDLCRWLDGRPIAVRPVSAAEKTWRWCRRRPVIAALVATLVITLSVGFVSMSVLWRRAETSFLMSMEMVGDLVDLLAGGEVNRPRAMTLDHLIPTLEHQRKRLLDLDASRPADLWVAHQLALIEHSLSFSLMRAGKHDEARTVLLESLGRGEDLVRRHPSESTPRSHLRGCLQLLAGVSERLGKFEDGIAYCRRAIQSCEEEVRLAPTAAELASLIESRRNLAWHLYSRGDLVQARSLIAANRRTLEHPPAGCEGRPLAVPRLLSRIDSAELLLGAASANSSETGKDEARGLPPLSRLASPTDVSQSPEDWARLAAHALRCGDPDPRTAARREAEDALLVVDHLTAIASRLRTVQDVEGACRIAERILALAKHFVAAYPGEPASYLALSFAYAQMYKNAYEAEDMASVKANMKLAHAAAQEALLWDLGSEKARHAVDDLQRRLAKLPPKD